MVAIDAIPLKASNSALTTAFNNKVDLRQAELYYAMGGRSGNVEGGAYSVVAGQQQLSVAAGAWFVRARDGSQNEQRWGYLCQTRAASVVQFTAPGGTNRRDALVVAVADPAQAGGTFGGSLALAAGGHLVAVPGVSPTVNLTDAQIQSAVGSGGFHRIADVLMTTGQSQISAGNITFAGYNINNWNTIPGITAASGWSITYARYMLFGLLPMARISMWLVRTGGTLSASSVGNLTDTLIAQNVPTFLRAIDNPAYGTCVIPGRILGSARVETDGQMSITDIYPTADIVATDNLRVDFNYALV